MIYKYKWNIFSQILGTFNLFYQKTFIDFLISINLQSEETTFLHLLASLHNVNLDYIGVIVLAYSNHHRYTLK